MSKGKNEFTEAEKAAIAAVSPKSVGEGESSKGEIVAATVAFIVTLGSLAVGIFFGAIEISQYEKQYNWPLIAALVVTVTYAWLFVALYSNVVTNSRKLDILLKR